MLNLQIALECISCLKHLATLVREEGIDNVKHLKEVVPLLVNILSDPFALAHVALMGAAVRTLGDVVRMAWPRMEGWKGEVLKGLCLAWARIEEEGRSEENNFQDLMANMKQCIAMLDKALRMDGKGGLEKDAETLGDADERLHGLLDT